MRRNRFAYRYSKILLNSYIPFVLFFVTVLGAIIYSTMAIKVDVIKSFACEMVEHDDQVLVDVKGEVNTNFEHIYIYTDKNMRVYKLKKISMSTHDGDTFIEVPKDSNVASFIHDAKDKAIHVDIPQAKEPLLRRMFNLGGH